MFYRDEPSAVWPTSVVPGLSDATVEARDAGAYVPWTGDVPEEGSAIGAAFRLENPYASAVVSEARAAPRHREEGFNPYDFIKGTPYEAYRERFLPVFNKEHMTAVIMDINREMKDKELLDSVPLAQRFAYGLVAGLVDPLLLVPGGAFIQGGRGGFVAWKSALSVAGAAGGMSAVQEAALHATQQTRTIEESFANIGASTLLGGLLGAGGARLMTNLEVARLVRQVEDEVMAVEGEPARFMNRADLQRAVDWNLQRALRAVNGVEERPEIARIGRELLQKEIDIYASRLSGAVRRVMPEGKFAEAGITREFLEDELKLIASRLSPLERNIMLDDVDSIGLPGDLGAAARKSPTLEALTIAGASDTVARVTAWMNPNLRLSMSPNPVVRQISMALTSRGYYMRGNESGFKSPQSVEAFRDLWRGGLVTSIEATDQQWAKFRERGGAMRHEEFRREVGKTWLLNQSHKDPEVNAAADAWRKGLFDPGNRDAMTLKLFPEDLEITAANSYYGRIFNRVALGHDEFGFKSAIREWVKRNIPKWRDEAMEDVYRKMESKPDKIAGRSKEDRINDALEEIDDIFGNAEDFAKEIADQAYGYAIGKFGTVERANYIKVAGLDRTFSPPNEILLPWLETDIRAIGDRFALTMGTDIELARMFGTVDMREQIREIRDSYAKLREAAQDKPKTVQALNEAERRDIRDIEALRDLLRGTYKEDQDQNFARLSRMVSKFNYIRMMGMVVLASIPEAARVAMVHGLRPFMETMGQSIQSPKGFKASKQELKLMGVIGDVIMSHRLMTVADIFNNYHNRGPVERMLDNMVEVANHWNGLRLWTDYWKGIAGVTTQNRILRNAENFVTLSNEESRYMHFLGIGQGEAERIAAKFKEHGEIEKGVYVANTERWGDSPSDQFLVRTFRAAVLQDVNSIVIHRSVGDIPLFANTPLGRLIFQFNTFNLASHQRILLRGLQEGHARFLASLVAMTSMGMMQTYIRSILNNRDVPDPGENPGWWVAEGLDYSGVLMLPMQMANMSERAIGFNPVKSGLKAFDTGDARSMRMRDVNFAHVFGPTVGTIEDVLRVAQIPLTLAEKGEVSQGQVGAAERLLPYNSYLGMRSMLRYVVNPPEN